MKQLEDEWAALIGKKRFDEFLRTLRRLSAIDVPPASSGTSQGREKTKPGRVKP
jgi:hypothetical protein